MVDIVDEIVNDEKDARRVYYFRKFLPIILIATIIIAIGITVYGYHQNKQEEHKRKIGDMFIDVATGNVPDTDVARSSLEEIINNSGIRTAEMARIQLIHGMIAGNMHADAKGQLQAIIDDSNALEITKAYARILYVAMVLEQNVISDSEQLLVTNLLQFFASEDTMFYPTSQLLKALFHYKIGQYEVAKNVAMEVTKIKTASIIVKDQAAAVIVMLKYKK